MATTKKATKKAVSAKTGGTRFTADSVVTFKKAAKEDALPPQALAILTIVEKAGSLTIGQLQAKMEGKIESSQAMATLWGFYQGRLKDGGHITVVKAEKPVKAAKVAKTKKAVQPVAEAA